MIKQNKSVNLLKLLCVLALTGTLTSCGTTGGGGSGSSDSSGPFSMIMRFFEAFSEIEKAADEANSTMTDTERAEIKEFSKQIPPAKVVQSTDPNVKYHTLRTTWDIEKDVETFTSYGKDEGFDITIRRSNPYMRYLVPLRSCGASLAVIDKDSFDAVTLDDVKNAKNYHDSPRSLWDDDAIKKVNVSDSLVEAAFVEAVPPPLAEVGQIIGIKTSQGNYVKAQIIGWEGIEAKRTDKCYIRDDWERVNLEILGWETGRGKDLRKGKNPLFNYGLNKGVVEKRNYIERYSPKLQYVIFPNQ